jgi:hypothetical protein
MDMYDKCPWVFGLLFFQFLQKFLLLDQKKLKISIHSLKYILAWVIVSWNRDQVDLLSESLGAFCGLWMSEVILSPWFQEVTDNLSLWKANHLQLEYMNYLW